MSFRGSLLKSVFIDSPEVLDASVTPIPANSGNPVQIVASLSIDVQGLRFVDGIQQGFIGVYVGAFGQEVLTDIIGGTVSAEHEVAIPKGSRVSLRSMSSQAMSAGLLKLVFKAG